MNKGLATPYRLVGLFPEVPNLFRGLSRKPLSDSRLAGPKTLRTTMCMAPWLRLPVLLVSPDDVGSIDTAYLQFNGVFSPGEYRAYGLSDARPSFNEFGSIQFTFAD